MAHPFVEQRLVELRILVRPSAQMHPRLLQAEEVRAVPAAKPSDGATVPRARQSETILVVEDNEGVRDYAKGVLAELGYQVLEAGDAHDALRLLAANSVDLLFTDVVLPGPMTGRALADKVSKMRPGLPVLFTTGYTRNAIVHQGRLDPDVHLLNKPFTQQDLARKIRELLDAAEGKTPRAAS